MPSAMPEPPSALSRDEVRNVLADLLEAHLLATGDALLTLVIDLEESIARLVEALDYWA